MLTPLVGHDAYVGEDYSCICQQGMDVYISYCRIAGWLLGYYVATFISYAIGFALDLTVHALTGGLFYTDILCALDGFHVIIYMPFMHG